LILKLIINNINNLKSQYVKEVEKTKKDECKYGERERDLSSIRKRGLYFESIQDQKNFKEMCNVARKSLELELNSLPYFSDNSDDPCVDSIGWENEMMIWNCEEKKCHWNNGLIFDHFSIGISTEYFSSAIKDLQTIYKSNKSCLPQGILIRFVSQSNGLLDISSGKDVVVFDFVFYKRFDPKVPISSLSTLQETHQVLFLFDFSSLYFSLIFFW